MSKTKKLSAFTAIPLIMLLLYADGLSGPFLLDDNSTLPSLYESISTFGFWYGVFDGSAGPTGRPVSLLSFALQQPTWNDSYYFKLVNLILHILNCALLFILTYCLVSASKRVPERQVTIFSIIVCVLWAIHPIHVSTVLYVVQRMVLLCSFFTLSAIICYLFARRLLIRGQLLRGYSWLTLSLTLFGSLALLSKENGLLTLLYLIIIETYINHYHAYRSRLFSYWKAVFLVTPLLLFCAYLTFNYQTYFIDAYESRSFTLAERLLSQPRVLLTYIYHLVFPQGSQLSLFHENFYVSRSLFDPPTTIISLVVWLLVIIASIAVRHTRPLWFFCLFWYLGGHAMEAGPLALEMYFEHRNYLPSYAIIFAMTYLGALVLKQTQTAALSRSIPILGGIYFAMNAWITYQQSNMWGDELKFALYQAQEHPYSVRARALKVNAYSNRGMIDAAYQESKNIQRDFPHVASMAFYEIKFACYDSRYPLLSIDSLKQRLTHVDFDFGTIKIMDDLVTAKAQQACPALSYDYLRQLLNTLLAHPQFKLRRHHLATYLSLIELQQGNLERSIAAIKLIEQPNFDARTHLARLLATQGDLDAALQHLKLAKQELKLHPQYEQKIRILRDLELTLLEEKQRLNSHR